MKWTRFLTALAGLWVLLCAIIPSAPFDLAGPALRHNPATIVTVCIASWLTGVTFFCRHRRQWIGVFAAMAWMAAAVALFAAHLVVAAGLVAIIGFREAETYLLRGTGKFPEKVV